MTSPRRTVSHIGAQVSEHGLIGVRVARDKDQQSLFSGRLIGLRGEEPDAFGSISLDGEN
jgi:hypothetical protein